MCHRPRERGRGNGRADAGRRRPGVRRRGVGHAARLPGRRLARASRAPRRPARRRHSAQRRACRRLPAAGAGQRPPGARSRAHCARRPRAPSAAPVQGRRPGQPRLFGEGIVLKSEPTADDEEVTVAFPGKGTKTLLASFAKLRKIGCIRRTRAGCDKSSALFANCGLRDNIAAIGLAIRLRSRVTRSRISSMLIPAAKRLFISRANSVTIGITSVET